MTADSAACFCLQPTCRCHRAEMFPLFYFTFVIHTKLTSVNSTSLCCGVVWMVTTLKEVWDILRFLRRFIVFKKCSIVVAWASRGAEQNPAKGPPNSAQTYGPKNNRNIHSKTSDIIIILNKHWQQLSLYCIITKKSAGSSRAQILQILQASFTVRVFWISLVVKKQFSQLQL